MYVVTMFHCPTIVPLGIFFMISRGQIDAGKQNFSGIRTRDSIHTCHMFCLPWLHPLDSNHS